MDSKFNHWRERITVDLKIYNQLIFLVSFPFCLYVCLCILFFFQTKNIYSDTISTMRAGKW